MLPLFLTFLIKFQNLVVSNFEWLNCPSGKVNWVNLIENWSISLSHLLFLLPSAKMRSGEFEIYQHQQKNYNWKILVLACLARAHYKLMSLRIIGSKMLNFLSF